MDFYENRKATLTRITAEFTRYPEEYDLARERFQTVSEFRDWLDKQLFFVDVVPEWLEALPRDRMVKFIRELPLEIGAAVGPRSTRTPATATTLPGAPVAAATPSARGP